MTRPGRKLEVSVAGGGISGGAGVEIRNLTVEKFGNRAQTGAIIASSGWLIAGVEVRLNHGVGDPHGPGHGRAGQLHPPQRPARHRTAARPLLREAKGLVLENSELSYNNTAGYNWGWEAGATKWTHTDGLIVRNNYVHDNYGHGLWTDGFNINTLYEGNVVEDNYGSGINHELGYAAVIRDNVVSGNGFQHPVQGDVWGAGIFIDQSRDVEVYGNTVEDNAAGITAVQQSRPGTSAGIGLNNEVANLFVHDNTIVQATGHRRGAAPVEPVQPGLLHEQEQPLGEQPVHARKRDKRAPLLLGEREDQVGASGRVTARPEDARRIESPPLGCADIRHWPRGDLLAPCACREARGPCIQALDLPNGTLRSSGRVRVFGCWSVGDSGREGARLVQRRANFRSPFLGLERASLRTPSPGFRTRGLRPVVAAAVIVFLLFDVLLVIALMRGDDDALSGPAQTALPDELGAGPSSEPPEAVQGVGGTPIGVPILSDSELSRISGTGDRLPRREPAQSSGDGSGAGGSVSSSSSTTSGSGTSSSGGSS